MTQSYRMSTIIMCAVFHHYLSNYLQYPIRLNSPVASDLQLVITIPCFNEPDLIRSLEALYACEQPSCSIEVIVVVNSPENAPDNVLQQNRKTLSDASTWMATHNDNPSLQFHLIHQPDLPKKHAGVGFARKIAMDEAVARFKTINNPNGIIAGFDADAICDPNYLTELVSFFSGDNSPDGASIYFEHPLTGNDFDEAVYEYIVLYELHLRYYVQALRYALFPYAYHTVGSSFAVKARIYAKQGGMNRRKAGEDFYFLHKVIPLRNFGELNSTRIIPSPRPSMRVPFGTGATMQKCLTESNYSILTYNPLIFDDLRLFLQKANQLISLSENRVEAFLTSLPESVRVYLKQNHFDEALHEMQLHSTNPVTFKKRFFHWFNAFRVMKLINNAHESQYQKIPVYEAALCLLKTQNHLPPHNCTYTKLLKLYRKIDRKHQSA